MNSGDYRIVAVLSVTESDPCICFRRFAAAGGAAPLLPPPEMALRVAQLAEACCSSGELADETDLVKLLHNCCAALHADITAAAETPPPAATHAAAAAVTSGGTSTGAGPAEEASREPCASSAVSQPSKAVTQRASDSAGKLGHTASVQPSKRLSAEQPGGTQQHQSPQPPSGATERAWQSAWVLSVTTAMHVRSTFSCLL
jgi:hypothetical protein